MTTRPGSGPPPSDAAPAGPVPPALPSLPVDEVARAAARSRSTGPWSLAHLKACWFTLLAVGVVVVIVAAAAAGGTAASGAAVGVGIVGAFFTASTVVIAAVGARHPKAVMLTALGVYFVKIVALGAVIVLLPPHGPIAPRWMAIAVAVGLVAWMAAHLRFVATAKIFYVDPH